MKKVERKLWLEEDAAALLIQLAGGPRKQGDYLTALIREQARHPTLHARIASLAEELRRLQAEVAAQEPARDA